VSRVRLGRLLVVDDESNLVTALCRTLAAQGYSTVGVATGLQALDALRAAGADDSTRFDVLITDLMMPMMDGIALLRAARNIDGDLVSIVMTGHGTVETAVDAMKAGALDYILKPFNLSVAIPVLSRALAVRRLRLENTSLLGQVAKRTVELEESNRRLQAANNDLDAYSASVSHDIRGHLHRIIGFARLLSDGRADPLTAKQQEFMDFVCIGAEDLLRMTDDLLSFARLGQQPVIKERVSVTTLIHEIFRDLRNESPDATVELRMSSLPDAFADPSLLKQVFVNLLSNAIKFSSLVSAPVVKIDGRVEAGECIYSIRDNGAGFDMAHADRLFKMFHRLHSSAEFAGTGVGLSIVQRIVERHGGRIWVEAAIGAGAEFTFTLPEDGSRRADDSVPSGSTLASREDG
jgi:two-component system sensor histidine kinase/response regulator